jgi:hypothetical protein
MALPQMAEILKLDDAESNIAQNCGDSELWGELEKVGESHDEEDNPYSMQDSGERCAGSCENHWRKSGR